MSQSCGRLGHVGVPHIDDEADADLQTLVEVLRAHGVPFAFLHGSRVTGTPRPDSDLDVAAWLPEDLDAWTVPVGDHVDLHDLRKLPLSVAGRVALKGRLLFDDDPPERVHWQAQTRQRYFDEEPRRRMITADTLKAASRG